MELIVFVIWIYHRWIYVSTTGPTSQTLLWQYPRVSDHLVSDQVLEDYTQIKQACEFLGCNAPYSAQWFRFRDIDFASIGSYVITYFRETESTGDFEGIPIGLVIINVVYIFVSIVGIGCAWCYIGTLGCSTYLGSTRVAVDVSGTRGEADFTRLHLL